MDAVPENLFLGVDHTVWLVADIDAAIANWQGRLGVQLQHRVDGRDHEAHQAFFPMADGTFVELIAPADEDSPVNKLIEEHGEGVHVLAMRVANLDAAVEQLTDAGVELRGAGTPQVFVKPQFANGTLLQLWPEDRPHRWRDEPRQNPPQTEPQQ